MKIVSIFSEFTQSRYDLPTVISSDNFQHTIGITLTPTGHGADFLCHFFQSCRIAVFIYNCRIYLFTEFCAKLLKRSCLRNNIAIMSWFLK